jgi:hypothetical protein
MKGRTPKIAAVSIVLLAVILVSNRLASYRDSRRSCRARLRYGQRGQSLYRGSENRPGTEVHAAERRQPRVSRRQALARCVVERVDLWRMP